MLVDDLTLRDIGVLGRCTVEDHLSIRDAVELHIGPTFAQTGRLGGADADLVYDGTLLDLKSTGTARVLGRVGVWQLLGYLLADTDDAYRIRRLGFSALRRHRSIFWSVQEMIDLLAGENVSPVEHWRGEFAGLLASCSSGYDTAASRYATLRRNSETATAADAAMRASRAGTSDDDARP